jgi:hypothetical protein
MGKGGKIQYVPRGVGVEGKKEERKEEGQMGDHF